MKERRLFMKLIIAEKPVLGESIAAAIPGNGTKNDGTITKGDWTVVWCFGHLMTLADPEDYDESYKKWSLDQLPIYFDDWKIKVKPETSSRKGGTSLKARVKQIFDLMDTAEFVVNAGDMDEEGHRVEPDTDNLIIYGHNMGDDSMFGCLKYYERNYDYYGQHPIIELNSNYMRYKYKIFAFFIVDSEDKSDTAFDCWNKLNFNTEEEFYDFVNEAKKRTIRLNDVDVKYGDSLITLSTCNTLLGDRGRLIILARRVRDGEDELAGTQNSKENPNIKWPTLYYDFKSSAKKYDPNAEFVPYGPETAETAAAETETATEANTNE